MEIFEAALQRKLRGHRQEDVELKLTETKKEGMIKGVTELKNVNQVKRTKRKKIKAKKSGKWLKRKKVKKEEWQGA